MSDEQNFEVIERDPAACLIYEVMRWATGHDALPEWVGHGDTPAQWQARSVSQRIRAALSSTAPEGKAAQTPTDAADAMLADIVAIIEPKGDAEGTFSGTVLQAVMEVQRERDTLHDALRIIQRLGPSWISEIADQALSGRTRRKTANGSERELCAAFAHEKHDWPARWIAAALRGENSAYTDWLSDKTLTPPPSVKHEETGSAYGYAHDPHDQSREDALTSETSR